MPAHGSHQQTEAHRSATAADHLLRVVDRRLCSTASVTWFLNFGGFKWMLIAGACFTSFISCLLTAH